jgi:type IV secretion system protein VirB3
MSDETDGFEVPLHRALVQPLLVAGLPRTLAYLLWTVSMAFGLGLHQSWMFPIALGLHAVFAAAARYDPYFFDIFLRALRANRRLEP